LINIGQGAFSGTAITSITIPDSVISLGDGVFSSCFDLTQVNIGSGLTTIPRFSFYYCSSLESITIPANITLIEDSAFDRSGLSSIVFKNTSVEIDDDVFFLTPLLNNASTAEDFLIIDNILICYYGQDSSVTIPDGIVNIAGGAFSGHDLEEIIIPDGVTIIGSYAFYKTGLTSITIPKSVVKIGVAAIGYDYSVESETEFAVEYTIYGYTGTAAETYAATSDKFTFVALDKTTVTLDTGKISSLTNTSSGIKIKWTAVSGADGYYIYRKTSSGSYKKIKTITSIMFLKSLCK